MKKSTIKIVVSDGGYIGKMRGNIFDVRRGLVTAVHQTIKVAYAKIEDPIEREKFRKEFQDELAPTASVWDCSI